jgi:hypothetical protein
MLSRVVTFAIIAGAGYWYYTGPYQSASNPGYEEKLVKHQEDMRLCIRGLNYKSGATGQGSGDPEAECAQRFNLYKGDDGRWYSYDDKRK